MADYTGSFSGSFTGSLLSTDGVISSSAQVIGSLPAGVVSSSVQVIANLPLGVISSSAQIDGGAFTMDYFDLINLPVTITPFQANSILANSDLRDNFTAYVKYRLNAEHVLSGSIEWPDIVGIPGGIVSSSEQLYTTLDERYINELADGVFSSSIQVVLNDADKTGFTTDDVVEGSTNKYYTDSRVKTKLNIEGVISGSEQVDYTYIQNVPDNLVSSSNQIDYNYIQNVPDGIISGSGQVILVDADNTDFDTSYVEEHPDYLYYTNQRVGVYINNLGVISGSEQVDYNYIQNVPSGIISSSNQLIPEFDIRYGNELADGLVSSSIQVVLIDSDNTDFDTSYVEEHPDYLYYTNQRVGVYINNLGVISSSAQVILNDADFTGFNTDDVDEGSTNLYYTNDRVKTKLNTENVVSSSQQVSDFGFIDEQQTLSIIGNTLYISNGNSVVLPQQGVGTGASIWTTGSQDPDTWTYLETQNNLVVTGSVTIKGNLTVNGQSVFNQTEANDDASAVEVNGRLSMVERQINGYIASASIKIGNTRDVIDCGGFF
jgi:hypothetical protein